MLKVRDCTPGAIPPVTVMAGNTEKTVLGKFCGLESPSRMYSNSDEGLHMSFALSDPEEEFSFNIKMVNPKEGKNRRSRNMSWTYTMNVLLRHFRIGHSRLLRVRED